VGVAPVIHKENMQGKQTEDAIHTKTEVCDVMDGTVHYTTMLLFMWDTT